MTILLGVALIKKSTEIRDYILPVSLVGLAIAIYHYYLQLYPEALAPCSTIGFSVSCTERFFTRYGYITIPFMSLTAFFVIASLMIILRMKKK
jgi:disulfide bond formation protein DsbB